MMEEAKQLKKFYESILKEIKKLVEDKLFPEALKRIEEELASSYIPLEYEKKLQEMIVETRIKQYEHADAKIAKYDVDKLIQFVLSDVVKNYDAFVFLIDKHGPKITANQWQQIMTIFILEKLSNSVKFLFFVPLLEIKQLQQKPFLYFNKSTNKTQELTFSKNLFKPFDKFTSSIFKTVNEQFFKEPSKLQLAEHLIDLLTIHFFPDFIPYDQVNLADEIIKYVEGSFMDKFPEKQMDAKALKLINLVLTNDASEPKF